MKKIIFVFLIIVMSMLVNAGNPGYIHIDEDEASYDQTIDGTIYPAAGATFSTTPAYGWKANAGTTSTFIEPGPGAFKGDLAIEQSVSNVWISKATAINQSLTGFTMCTYLYYNTTYINEIEMAIDEDGAIPGGGYEWVGKNRASATHWSVGASGAGTQCFEVGGGAGNVSLPGSNGWHEICYEYMDGSCVMMIDGIDAIRSTTASKTYLGIGFGQSDAQKVTGWDFIRVWNGYYEDEPAFPPSNPPVIESMECQSCVSGTNTTSDTTPIVNATTDIDAICNISKDNFTWLSCSTTGGTNHICTMSEAFIAPTDYANITFNCSATAGSSYATIVLNITESTPPTVLLQYPADESLFVEDVNNSMNLSFIVTDNYFTSLACNLTIDGLLNQTNSSVNNGTLTYWDEITFEQGKHKWNVSCIDGHGNANSSQRNFTVLEDTCTVDSISLYLDGLNESRKYELYSTVNLIANYTATTSISGVSCLMDTTICLDIDAPNEGFNTTCQQNVTSYGYNITILRQTEFNDSTESTNLTSSGSKWFDIDNRTDVISVTVDITGYDNSGYPENITINGTSLPPGVLNGSFYTTNLFIQGGEYYTIKNSTFSDADIITIYINMTGTKENLSFDVSGFDADAGNEVDFTEYFNDTSETNIAINNSNGVDVEIMGMYENFETNSYYWRIDGTTGGTSVLKESTDCFNKGACWYMTYTSTAPSNANTQYVENSNQTSWLVFDLKNFKKVVIEWYFYWSFSKVGSSTWSGTATSAVNLEDISNNEIELVKISGGGGCSYSDVCSGLKQYNCTLVLDMVVDNSTVYHNLTCTTWDGTTSGTYGVTGSDATGSLTSNESWYLEFKEYVAGLNEVSGNSVSGSTYILNVTSSGLWLNKTGNGTHYGSSGTITSNIIANSTEDYTGIYVSASTLEPTGSTITYEYSADGETTWKDATAFVNTGEKMSFDTSGTNITYRVNMTHTNNNQTPILYSLRTEVIPESLTDLYVDLGQDGNDYEFDYPINSTNSPQTLNFSKANLSDVSDLVAIDIFSTSAGLVMVSNINAVSDPNPVNLTTSLFETCRVCDIAASFTNGILQLGSLAVDFLGSWNYTALAHTTDYSFNDSHLIQVKYSNYNLTKPYTRIEFMPETITSKNVSPYGQQVTVPIYNVTSLAYDDPFNFSVRLNRTDDMSHCLNLTVSTGYYENQSVLTNLTLQMINSLPYLSSQGIWQFLQMNGCDPETRLFFTPYWYYKACCVDCVGTCWN